MEAEFRELNNKIVAIMQSIAGIEKHLEMWNDIPERLRMIEMMQAGFCKKPEEHEIRLNDIEKVVANMEKIQAELKGRVGAIAVVCGILSGFLASIAARLLFAAF